MIAPDPALAGPRPAARPEPGRSSEPRPPAEREADDFASVLTASAPRKSGRPAETASEDAVPVVPPVLEATAAVVPPALPEAAASAVAGTTLEAVLVTQEAAPSVQPPAARSGEAPLAVGDVPLFALSGSEPASTVPPAAPDAQPPGAPATAKAPQPGPVQAAPAAPDRRPTPALAASDPPVEAKAAVVEKAERHGEPERPASSGAAAISPAPAPTAAATGTGPAPMAPLVASDAPTPHWYLAPEASAPTRAEAVPAAPSPAPTAPQAVIGQLAAAVVRSTDGQVEIRLDPPELGRVQIHLSQGDSGLEAVVLADRPETQDLLRRHADQLARELEAAGYQRVSLDFATGSEAAPRREEDRPTAMLELEAAPQTPAAAPARRTASAGGLDVRL